MIELTGGFRLPHDIIDILLVAFILYRMLLILRGTRAFQVLMGLLVILAAYVVSQVLGLVTLHWILDTFLSSFILVVVILFQNDIRRALAQMGKRPWSLFGHGREEHTGVIEELAGSAEELSVRRIGGLIVLERDTRLREHVDGGVKLEAILSRELLLSIFGVHSPIHDGAVIVRDKRVIWAACFLPLTTHVDLDKDLGTRHRAAMGITEETDAVAIVVSEQSGAISVGVNGRITRDLDPTALRRVLTRLLPGPGGAVRGKGRPMAERGRA